MDNGSRLNIVLAVSLLAGTVSLAGGAFAETKVMEGDSYIMTASPYFRTDFNMMENSVDLDTKIRDDRVQYIGIDYSLSFDLEFKNDGPEVFLKIQRNGLYDYDAPVIINNTLQTYLGKVHPYKNAELLPEVREYWIDVPVYTPQDVRLKPGLFMHEVGHGISLNGNYQNYGIELYTDSDDFRWNIYTCWPDYENKPLLGPYIKQEKPQMIDYEHGKTYFLSTDLKVSKEKVSVQPYVGLLMDYSVGKRLDLFQTPTDEDILGTVGVSWDFNFDKFSFSAEYARNFGRARSSQAGLPDVDHRGYAVYADASYSFGKFTPVSRFIFASGNKLTTDMITNGDTTYTGSKNNAFSVYSPMNGYLADSVYPSITTLPIVAMGNGNAMNYGVRHAGTFGDPAQIENLVLVDLGFTYNPHEKINIGFDWWYLANAQKGIGMYNNVPKVISPELGNEVDIFFEWLATKNIALGVVGGIFLPGPAYREERTDVNGSLFTPYVRGDGKADPAYQLEMSMEMSF